MLCHRHSVTFNGRPAGCMWSAEVMSAASESLRTLLTYVAYSNVQLFSDTINSANIFKPREQTLGAVAKLRTTTISFAPSVCPHGTTRLPLDGFSCNFILEYSSKIFKDNSSLINPQAINVIYIYIYIYICVCVCVCVCVYIYIYIYIYMTLVA